MKVDGGREARTVSASASAMALGAGVMWSFGAAFSRLADSSDAWQYLIWRSVGVIVVLETVAALRGRRSSVVRAFTSGWVMFVGCLGLGVASLSYVYAVKNTSSMNAALLSAITPLMAALVARVALGEHLDRTTLVSIAVAIVGLAIMVTGPSGTGQGRTWMGDFAAVASTVGFGVYAACVRSSPDIDWSPIMPGYGVMMIAVCGAITVFGGQPIVPGGADVGWALAHGGILIVVGTLLYNAGSKHISAGATSFFAQTENVLVPFWIFVFIGDRPGVRALIGGAIVLLAIFAKAWYDVRVTRVGPLSSAVAANSDPVSAAAG